MERDENTLRRTWLEQLIREHRQICWQYRLPLRTPIFEICDSQIRAGAWSPGFDTLSLAAWLIKDHAWEVVLGVLQHEMSHQYVWEVLERGKEPPHGLAFQEACERLGVPLLFRSAQGEIPRLLAQGNTPASNPVLRKVEKLFALAASANEHEATLAMEKANAFLRKHNLERIRNNTAAEFDYLILNPGRKQLSAQERLIAAILKDFFWVLVVVNRRFDAATGESHRVFELTAARENLLVAEYVYHFLKGCLRNLWNEYRKRSGVPARERNSYQLGILKGLREKLVRGAKTADGGASESAVVCSQDPGLIRFYRSRYPRLRTVRQEGPRIYASSFEKGQAEGRRLIIHRGLAAADGNCGRLLSD